MNLLVVGGGGREHAIIKKLKENPAVTEIFCLPGNGGISYDATCVPIGAMELDEIAYFAQNNNIDFAVVGPDDPLANGAADRLLALGIPVFGPEAKAALIESSKVFAKELMKKYNIPTADYEVFDAAYAAMDYIKAKDRFPVVIKTDGLALGKGVIIAETLAEAEQGIQAIMTDRVFGDSGDHVVIEEFLQGPEVSVLAFTDSKTMVPMVSSMDHKRALDNDRGPNTGGMGTIAPNPYYTEEIAARCMREIFLPTMQAMNAEGRPFRGCLYFGLMLTDDGPKVIEYNCRFGDPEAQVVLPLLSTDLLTIMQAVAGERLSEIGVTFENGTACCVVAASGGYPGSYKKGIPIEGLIEGQLPESVVPGALIFHAGTALGEDGLVTSGGRVLGVTAKGKSLTEAIEKAYKAVEAIHFDGMHFRKDIGGQALAASEKK